ncbi:MAG: hypothetical protein MZV63_27125 [Marinilabiliales bacterium]|nr:hypothetical protein [Marinilabiliales bacterium]
MAGLVVIATAAALFYRYVYNKPHTDYVEAKTEVQIGKRLWIDYSMNKDIAGRNIPVK